MTSYLDHSEKKLKEQQGYWTAREIAQQPSVWTEVAELVDRNREEFNQWLSPIIDDEHARIILTGAGTSAYIGQAIAPHLTRQLSRPVEAISTTDIVATPSAHLLKNRPTLIISFARSGNSPESVAACELAEQLIDQCFHLIITCNKEGALAEQDLEFRQKKILIMPEVTNDRSFAMTSSFTSMMLTSIWIFDPRPENLGKAIVLSQQLLSSDSLKTIRELSQKPFNRAVFLGSSGLMGIAREAALKMLELTAGEIDCYFESPLGFRHGPKLIVDKNTLVVILNSLDHHSKKYDSDLIAEIRKDGQTEYILELAKFMEKENLKENDVWLSLPYIVFCQILAFEKSLRLGYTPDNPCPSGEANRVVQGVKIYPYESST